MNAIPRYYGGQKDFRVTVINEDYDWFDSNASTWIRFWDGTEIRLNRFIAYYGSAINTNTLYCDTYLNNGTTIYAAGFNIYRKNSDGSVKWSQTGNWQFTYENKDMNAFVIKAKTGDAQFYDGEGQSKVIGPEYNAMAYGIFFREKTNSICYGKEEGNNLSALSGVWNQLQGAANASTNGSYLLKSDEEIAAFKTSSEYYTHDAFLRYSHIVGKYNSLTDFIGLNNNPAGRLVDRNIANGVDMTAIVAGAIAVTFFGVMAFAIRRKRLEK